MKIRQFILMVLIGCAWWGVGIFTFAYAQIGKYDVKEAQHTIETQANIPSKPQMRSRPPASRYRSPVKTNNSGLEKRIEDLEKRVKRLEDLLIKTTPNLFDGEENEGKQGENK